MCEWKEERQGQDNTRRGDGKRRQLGVVTYFLSDLCPCPFLPPMFTVPRGAPGVSIWVVVQSLADGMDGKETQRERETLLSVCMFVIISVVVFLFSPINNKICKHDIFFQT